MHFFNENVCILIKFSWKYVSNSPINNIPELVQIMAKRRSGEKSLFEPMMVSLQAHICITRPQRVKVSVRKDLFRSSEAKENIEDHWCIYASLKLVITGSGKNLSPFLQQAFTWIKGDFWKLCTWKYCLQMVRHFVWAPMCYWRGVTSHADHNQQYLTTG